ncbi:hypothetical protein AMATHDRAFT_64343 [Amanita thiersii Skay4041]|uniref:Uncharacterized protein n=1 Tax=Amanita thiersii Skay4041 TaxID=703135 RepID=A0A2A9NMJ0_9AGAR|nr:hypothetical protein AMATHDRAFT_64343 [Amanita thiersii Skay4041]
MNEFQRSPYSGVSTKLVIAFDIGTTFSGVSYALLEPGQVPIIHGVTQYPGQRRVGGDSKIPSIVCYDEAGNLVAAGAEADAEINSELLEMEGLTRAEWFKLHLRPPHLATEQRFDINRIPPLPQNKTAIRVFSDLLGYLFISTKTYIQQRQGSRIWESVEGNIDYVLSHPNGWEGRQQAHMRRAAITAGLVSDDSEALQRIKFVTEGEASLCFCLNKIPTAFSEDVEGGVMVVDCGGGTIDLSTYIRTGKSSFKEVAAPECLFQGSIFVTTRAHAFLKEKLSGSRYDQPAELDLMRSSFDKTTKISFKSTSKSYFVRFGGTRDNDPDFDIRAGSVKLSGSQVATFFEPAIESIVQAIQDQSRKSNMPIKTVLLVGGFATSDYLYSSLSDHLRPRNINILRPDAYLNKAVAEGSVSFYIDHFVNTRVSKYTYGVSFCPMYDPDDPEHVDRKRFPMPGGGHWVVGGFSTILEKGTEVSEETEFKKFYTEQYCEEEFELISIVSCTIKCYRGREAKAPGWLDKTPALFPDLCMITADISAVKESLRPQVWDDQKYYVLAYHIILLFGLTELKAQISWRENGVEKRGPASIVYDIGPTRNEG